METNYTIRHPSSDLPQKAEHSANSRHDLIEPYPPFERLNARLRRSNLEIARSYELYPRDLEVMLELRRALLLFASIGGEELVFDEVLPQAEMIGPVGALDAARKRVLSMVEEALRGTELVIDEAHLVVRRGSYRLRMRIRECDEGALAYRPNIFPTEVGLNSSPLGILESTRQIGAEVRQSYFVNLLYCVARTCQKNSA